MAAVPYVYDGCVNVNILSLMLMTFEKTRDLVAQVNIDIENKSTEVKLFKKISQTLHN